MNEYNFNVKFEKGRISSNLKKLVQNDYNSTKINFTFDREGRKLFKMLYPDGTPYIIQIDNNELIFGPGVLSQDGTYEVEIALYTEDGRLTDYATTKFDVRAELIQTDEIVEIDDRVPILDGLINEVNEAMDRIENIQPGSGSGTGGTGENGATFTPTVSSNGVISWSNDKGLTNPTPVNIRGPQGIQGERGIQGEKGDTGATGPQGPKGETGETGPVGPKGDAGNEGPMGPQGPAGNDGAKGDKGDKGDTGEQGPRGEKGQDGYTPVKGKDYFTEADKQEMVDLVLAAIPSAEEVGF